MIMSDGELATIMQQQDDDEASKFIEKEQRSITSNPTGTALLLVWSVSSLHHFLQSYTPQNLGVSSKVTNLEIDSMFFFADRSLHLQTGFRVAKKMPL